MSEPISVPGERGVDHFTAFFVKQRESQTAHGLDARRTRGDQHLP